MQVQHFYLKLFYVTVNGGTFIAQSSIKVKSHFRDIDQLVTKVKSVTTKSKTLQRIFSAFGYQLQSVVSRWVS